MILGKVMMAQSANKRGSVEYQISKKTLMLGNRIKDYSLEMFIKEAGVSKTSLMRYLNSLGVNTFTSFREIITLESIKGITALETIKYNYKEEQLDKQAVKLGKIIKEAKRVIVLGDGNCFSLMIYMNAFIHLGIDFEIPIYLGKEEDIFDEYALSKDDLVIFISLHETFRSFLDHRTMFYKDVRYFQFNCPCRVAFVGEVDLGQEPLSEYQFIVDIDGLIYERKMRLDKLFEEAMSYLCLSYEFVY